MLDVGCNRGLVGLEFAANGAATVHGCDIFEEGIHTAREIFVDLRAVKSQFEVVDLTHGPSVFEVFGGARYDIVLLLAVIHKLRRSMEPDALKELVWTFGNLTDRYIGWRSVGNDKQQAKEELELMDGWLLHVGLRRVQTSWINNEIGPAAIWEKR